MCNTFKPTQYRTLIGFLVALLSVASVTSLTPVNLGTSANYVILAETGISTTGTTAILGNLGVSPAAASYITGFGLILDSTGTFSGSSLVTGSIYAADYSSPTPSELTTAVSDMLTAYNDAAGRLFPDFLNLAGGNLNGMALSPGLYKWTTPVTTGGNVTLSGNSSSIFIFQISGTLGFGPGSQILLTGGVQPNNIFWQTAGQVNLEGTSSVYGNILGKTAIVFGSGATLQNGRALAQSGVTMIANKLNKP